MSFILSVDSTNVPIKDTKNDKRNCIFRKKSGHFRNQTFRTYRRRDFRQNNFASLNSERAGGLYSQQFYGGKTCRFSGGRKQNSCFCAERGRGMDSVCDFIRVWKLRRSAFFHVQRISVFQKRHAI